MLGLAELGGVPNVVFATYLSPFDNCQVQCTFDFRMNVLGDQT